MTDFPSGLRRGNRSPNALHPLLTHSFNVSHVLVIDNGRVTNSKRPIIHVQLLCFGHDILDQTLLLCLC